MIDHAPTKNRRPLVDFSHVPEKQRDMHARLENWGKSCNGASGTSTSPMFRQAQTPNTMGYARDIVVPADVSDAKRIAKGVYFLPAPHRIAVHWFYVQRASVAQGRRALACTAEALNRYVIDARTMLINRGV